MKEPSRRAKVVIRHLPPSLSQNDLLALFNDRFNDRLNWFCFRPGKSSYKHQKYSRAYVELKKPEDVFEFAELFNGHVFVNEKGAQFKAIVEYAPSQRVPKPSAKKDSREDPDYLEFLKPFGKPFENLPSAEIQLERKEAELAAAPKETLVITPLMEYVRQKRAAESGTQRSLAVGRVGRSSRTASASKSGSSATKRGSEKTKYILKDSAKNASRKDKSTFMQVGKREDQPASSSGKEMSESETICGVEGSVSGITLTSDTGKKKILLLKGKEREIPHRETSPVENSIIATAPKQIQRREAGGRLIRKILLNNEACQTHPLIGGKPQEMQTLKLENGKPLPGSISSTNGHESNNDSPVFNSDGNTKRTSDDRFARKVLHGSGVVSEKQEKRTRNKDRPDRVVWTPLRRSDVSHSNGEHLSPSQSGQLLSSSVEVSHGERKDDISYGSKTVEVAEPASGGSHSRHNGRSVPAHIMKDDGSINTVEGKSSKRRGATGSGGNEKQVWIQKSSSGH